MKTTSKNETDLFILFQKFKESLDYIGYSIYLFLSFLIKNVYILLAIIIIGGIGGYFIDKYKAQEYKHEIIIVANFGSVNYLYEKLDGINLEEFSIQQANVRPITDIYAFIKERNQNLEMAKYMSDNSIKFEKFQPNQYTENFHRYHLITIKSNKLDEKGGVIDDFLNHLNNETYYSERQKIEKLNLSRQIEEYKISIEGINKILDKLADDGLNEGNVSVNTYSELFQLVNSKKSMIEELRKLEVEQLEQSKTIYDTIRITNIIDGNLKYKILLPVILISIFFVIVIVKLSYNRYKLMDKNLKSKNIEG